MAQREFTLFKVGDVVTQINDKEFIVVGEGKVTGVSIVDKHAFDEECTDSNCIHDFAHPQLLTFESGKRASGFWFDPIVKKRLEEKERNRQKETAQ